MTDGRSKGNAVAGPATTRLRAGLVAAQERLAEHGTPAILLVAGMEGAGKGAAVNRLHDWLDPRGVRVHTFWDPSDEERQRPDHWRFWRVLPRRGRAAILFGAWYAAALEYRYFGRWDEERPGRHRAAAGQHRPGCPGEQKGVPQGAARAAARAQRTGLDRI